MLPNHLQEQRDSRVDLLFTTMGSDSFEIVEGIFDRIFGSNKPQQNASVFRETGPTSAFIGGNEIHNISMGNMNWLSSRDWQNGPLSFLANSKYECMDIKFNMNKESVILFRGHWYSGDFVGDLFRGPFNGGTIQGTFGGLWSEFKAHPSAMVNGSVASFDKGILGLPKINPTVFSQGSPSESVSLLQIPVGYYCSMTDQKGNLHVFKVIKSCDNNSMDIELKEETGFGRSVTVKWEDIRRSSDPDLFDELTEITIGKRIKIPGLFSGIKLDALKEIEVSPVLQGYGKVIKHMDIDEKWLSPLGFSSGPRVLFDTKEDIQEFSKIYDDLKSGKFSNYFDSILDGISSGMITGYDTYLNMKPLFDSQKGGTIEGDRYVEAMKWMDRFLSYMNRKMIRRSDGKANVSGIRLLNNQLRKHIIAKLPKQSSPTVTPSQAQPSTSKSSKQGGSGLSGRI